MIEPALIGLRAIQYGAAAIVLGVPAFLLYSRAALAGLQPGWPVSLIRRAAVLLLLATLAALIAQTAVMTGSLTEAFRPETLGMMVSGTGIGTAYAARACLALLVLALALGIRPGARLWAALTLPALLIAASFAWTGHGAATEGAWRWPHLAADIVHAVAALVWVGAVAAFVALARPRGSADLAGDRFAQALTGFAGIGTFAVTALVLSGLVNAWVLVGPGALSTLLSTPWGQVLAFKLALFAAMLGLAALHRFRLAPGLLASPERHQAGLRLS
ncbi:MAG: copper homeostasis membrane protein CopD, partial [Brevundimonas sp.]